MQKFTTVLLAALLAGCGVAPTVRPQVSAGAVSAKFDPEVAAAKTEIKRALESDKGVRVESLSVSPTPLGTVYTFRATTVEGDDRFEVTGTYNALEGDVKVSKKQAASKK
jgi:hypothetical protein